MKIINLLAALICLLCTDFKAQAGEHVRYSHRTTNGPRVRASNGYAAVSYGPRVSIGRLFRVRSYAAPQVRVQVRAGSGGCPGGNCPAQMRAR